MPPHERQRAVVVTIPSDLGVEINVVGQEPTPSSIADASSFVVRRGGGHPLAPSPLSSAPVTDELARAKAFVANRGGQVVRVEGQTQRACEDDIRAVLRLFGDGLAGTQFVRAGINYDSNVDPNNEFGVFSEEGESLLNRSIEGVISQRVTRARMELLSRQASTNSQFPEERGPLAVKGFARVARSRDRNIQVTEDPEDDVKPFLYKISDDPEPSPSPSPSTN